MSLRAPVAFSFIGGGRAPTSPLLLLRVPLGCPWVVRRPRLAGFRNFPPPAGARLPPCATRSAAAKYFPPLSRPLQNRGHRISAWSGRSGCSSLTRRCPCRAPAPGVLPGAPFGTPFRGAGALRCPRCPSSALATLGTSVSASLPHFFRLPL